MTPTPAGAPHNGNPCYICGYPTAPFIRCGDRFSDPRGGHYQLLRCQECGFVALADPPGEGEEHYRDEDYNPFLSLKTPHGLLEQAYGVAQQFSLRWKRRLVRDIFAVLPADGERRRILDIGCGTGEFLGALKDEYAVEGIEPQPRAAQWARERLGLTVYTGVLNDLSIPAQSYDLITMWHVLEHLPDPRTELRGVIDLLKPQGQLLIALPNIRSFDARVYGRYWVALDAPRHQWHFSPHSLRRFMEQEIGLRMVRMAGLPLDLYFNVLWSEKIVIGANYARGLLMPFRLSLAIIGSLLWGAVGGQNSGFFSMWVKK